ncbi:hypothetical protein BOX15_Mlig000968g3 [Macrostomum lignano]|uniref:RNA-directed DNA polymerase n=1 Tax=Macrostomum lignano TaxID=282301 RepID=A0A267EUD9_9PLAT|nr:hypothetical protein BOX15_Mlig000968g3 [Macrostomum lignano]
MAQSMEYRLGEMPLSYPEIEQYFKRLLFYLEATEKNEQAKAVLLATCGESAFNLVEELIKPEDITKAGVTFKSIQDTLLEHFKPKALLHYERHVFHSTVQKDAESITNFVARLKQQANKCQYGELREDLILSQFIFGLRSQNLRQKLLSKGTLELNDAIQEGLMTESIATATDKPETIANVQNAGTFSRPRSCSAQRSVSFKQPQGHLHNQSSGKPKGKTAKCHTCGKSGHLRSACRFQEAKCHKCGKVGHLATVCRSKAMNAIQRMPSCSPSPGNTSSYHLELIHAVRQPKTGCSDQWFVRCRLGKTEVNMLVDTGSQVTVVPDQIAKSSGLELQPVSQKLRSYGGFQATVTSVIYGAKLQVIGGKSASENIYVGHDTTAILGMNFIPSLDLVRMDQAVRVSNEHKCLPVVRDQNSNFIASFRLRSGVSMEGMRFPARSLPFSMKSMVETELRRLLASGIIYSVKNPTVAAPIVPVVKPEGLVRPIRLCGDYSMTLNRLIDVDKYRFPKMEEILAKIPNAKFYTVLDLEQAFLQVALSPESQELTCISTHMGFFAFRYLQFGISAAPLIFQEIMDEVLRDVPFTASYQDDIIIGTPEDSAEKHMQLVRQVKDRLANCGFKINQRKSQECRREVRFLGFILRDGGMHPDPARMEAWKRLPYPKDKDQLRSALCTFRHNGVFCKNFSMIARPLYQLLKKGVHWSWHGEQSAAFDKLKSIIAGGVITAYDITKPLYLICDASKDGLGYVLAHDPMQRQVVWLGSRVLTPAESNYANIEREALAIVEGTRYFYQYLAGRKFTIISDHRPLQYIFNPNKVSERVSARIQRWALLLRAYDYNVMYVKGETMYAADTLSRLPLQSDSADQKINLLEINALEGFGNPEQLLQRIVRTKDYKLDMLKKYIQDGWPAYPPPAMLPYSRNKLEYTLQNGVIFKGLRIVPPSSLRSEILQMLHEDHPGIVRMLRLSRQYFWWPDIDAQINAFVQRCVQCQLHARKRSNANLSSWPETKSFFERVHVDIATFKGQRFLVLIDAFSKWVDVQSVPSMKASIVISALRKTFKYTGLPKNLVSDNGGTFVAEDFVTFLRENYIDHTLTPPGHHQSNGQVERVIEELKFYLRKLNAGANLSELERHLAGFCLFQNTTPHCNGSIPALLVFQQSPRTRLSAICTERTRPVQEPVPVFVRVEHKEQRVPSELKSTVGTNTFRDAEGRLVHQSDATARTEELPIDDSKQSGITPRDTDATTCQDSATTSPMRHAMQSPRHKEHGVLEFRRSTRVRRPPERLTYF